MQSQQISSSAGFKAIVDIITENVLAEKILLLPCQPFAKQLPIPERLPSHHFLILTKEPKPYNSELLRAKLEKECGAIASINIILHDLHTFNTHLQTQQYFFPELSQSTPLYNHTRIPLSPHPPMNPTLIQRSLNQSFSFLHRKSEQLLQSAADQWNRGIMNSESLAEAILHLYTAIEIVFTGHHPQTRNLLRLRNSTARFSADIASLFPYHTARERQLLNRLQRISMQQPSKTKSPMSVREYEATLRRAREVQMVTLLTCQHHIKALSRHHAALSVTNDASA